MANALGVVWLLAVPLENGYKHTYWFDNLSQQTEYFQSKKITLTDVENPLFNCSYLRKDNVIRFPANYDQLVGANYVMYKNSSYTDKWYYAFITKMEYVNDEMTHIYIETDVIQTWLKEYRVLPSFVEREHVDDDTVGLHTLPEGLELGEYVINDRTYWEDMVSYNICIGSTIDLNSSDLSDVASGSMYNGLFSGIKYYLVNHDQASEIIAKVAKAGKSDALISMFVCPSVLVNSTTTKTYAEIDTGLEAKVSKWQGVSSVGGEVIEYLSKLPTKPKNINGYEVQNNKLFTYPYCYMLMSNNCGGSVIYHYELFKDKISASDNTSKVCDFKIISTVMPSMSGCLIPLDYNGLSENYLERLQMGKFPICSWNTDVYTNWLTQNGVNIATGLLNGVAQTAIGVAGVVTAPLTGGVGTVMGAGAMTSGLAQISSTLGEVYQHSLIPPQVEGQINSADVIYSAHNLTFVAYKMTIKKEMAEIIDNYFTMFGYKVNRVKEPLTLHRYSYWFTKTIDVNIDGNVPVEDIQKIKDIYNKGFTFWVNRDNIGDYSVDNSIVTRT